MYPASRRARLLLSASALSFVMLLVTSLGTRTREASAALPQRSARPQIPTRIDENVAREDTGARFVGRLTKPLDYYRTHGRELYAGLKDKPWHGHLRPRQCRECPAGESAILKIQAISNVHRDRLTGLPPNGVVVGRVVNVGRYTDVMIGARPRATRPKPDEYYYIIKDRGDSLSADLYVARISFDNTGRPHEAVEIDTAQTNYRKCLRHRELFRTTSDGDFRNCPPVSHSPIARPGRGGATTLRNSAHGLFRFAAASEPSRAGRTAAVEASAWFSCDAGCCTAPWPP